MARQYQLPGVGFIQADEDGREYQIPGGGYFSDETVGAANGSGVGTAATGGAGEGYAAHYGSGAATAVSGGTGAGYDLHYGSGAGTSASGGAGEGYAPVAGAPAQGSGVGTAVTGGTGEGYNLHYGSGTGQTSTGGAGDGTNGSARRGGGGAYDGRRKRIPAWLPVQFGEDERERDEAARSEPVRPSISNEAERGAVAQAPNEPERAGVVSRRLMDLVQSEASRTEEQTPVPASIGSVTSIARADPRPEVSDDEFVMVLVQFLLAA